MLPTPRNPIGYSKEELEDICKKRGISLSVFDKTFGINTCGMAHDGSILYYVCDVERTLYKLRSKDGKYHAWD